MKKIVNYRAQLFILLIISIIIRSFLAYWIELGTDEAYYWTYAKYPDWSHYDHPGMVGWMIQAFSLNLLFDSELFIRLSAVVLVTLNTWIVFCIGRELKDERAGVRAAVLYTASIYAFVICGIFILPDTPLSLFWLLGFWMFLRFVKRKEHRYLIWAGLWVGLGILSKYTAAFLWLGFLLYLLCYDRRQFKNPCLYLSLLITAVCCLPILIWNLQNDFISFRFQGGRVALSEGLSLVGLGKELVGEFTYNNPVNFMLAVLAVIAVFRKRLTMEEEAKSLILLISLPMIGFFWVVALTRSALPHWSGPAYILLIFVSLFWLEEFRTEKKQRNTVTLALIVLALALTLSVAEIKTELLPIDHHTEAREIGKDDVGLDVYGWRQAGEQFKRLRAERIALGEMKEEDALIGNQWFPTANLHYYVARPLGMKVFGLGPLDRIHKYYWINQKEGGLTPGADYWYIADSRYFIDPEQAYAYTNFKEIRLIGVLPVIRNGEVDRNFFVYECKGLVYVPKELEGRSKK